MPAVCFSPLGCITIVKTFINYLFKMKKKLLPAAFFLLAALTACHAPASKTAGDAGEQLTSFVDPYIGSGGHGHVFLGANVPFGFVQLGPTQPVRGWDWCSGYHYSDSVIVGFSHRTSAAPAYAIWATCPCFP